MRIKAAAIASLSTFLFFSFNSFTRAALVVVEPDGKVIGNVLALQDSLGKSSKKESLNIVSLPSEINPPSTALISLVREGDTVKLLVKSKDGESDTDVTDFKDEIVAIEQKDQAKRISISRKDENFVIRQDNVSAVTQFPITINSKDKKLEVSTPSGDRFIEVYPGDAFATIHNADLFDNLSPVSSVLLTESEKGELQYVLPGEKNVNLLNLFTINAPVEISMSAINGQVIKIDRPVWLKLIGFLLDSR